MVDPVQPSRNGKDVSLKFHPSNSCSSTSSKSRPGGPVGDGFTWNTGCLIGILIRVYDNPHITGQYFIPYIQQITRFFFIAQLVFWDLDQISSWMVSQTSYTVDVSELRPTSWYGKYTIIYRVSYIPGCAGFLPSTASYQKILENGYPGNQHIPSKITLEDDFPFPQVGYVSSQEGIWSACFGYICRIFRARRIHHLPMLCLTVTKW